METEPRREGKGSDVHASEQPNLTATPPPPQPSRDEVEQLFRNLKADPSSIRRLRFYESQTKLDQRERLKNAMLVSANSAKRARSDRARDRFWTVNLDANFYTFENTAETTLAKVVDLLRAEYAIAEAWEALEGGEE